MCQLVRLLIYDVDADVSAGEIQLSFIYIDCLWDLLSNLSLHCIYVWSLLDYSVSKEKTIHIYGDKIDKIT